MNEGNGLRMLSVLSPPLLHTCVIPAQAAPSPLSPAPPDGLLCHGGATSALRHRSLTACSAKIPPLAAPAGLISLPQPNSSSGAAQSRTMSCQDFNEQFPQTPSRDETRPSRCTGSSVCSWLVQTAAGTAMLPVEHHSSREVPLLGRGIVVESLCCGVFTRCYRGEKEGTDKIREQPGISAGREHGGGIMG